MGQAMVSPSRIIIISAALAPTYANQPPVWPAQFHAVLAQNRSGLLADVDLYYDWPGRRNLNIINDHNDAGPLYDNERNDGSTYYYRPKSGFCRILDMRVGILTPDWLSGANYLGQSQIRGHNVDIWAKGDSMDGSPRAFVTYYADSRTEEPVRWVFFDGAIFDVQMWLPEDGSGKGLALEETWRIPHYCFERTSSDLGELQANN